MISGALSGVVVGRSNEGRSDERGITGTRQVVASRARFEADTIR